MEYLLERMNECSKCQEEQRKSGNLYSSVMSYENYIRHNPSVIQASNPWNLKWTQQKLDSLKKLSAAIDLTLKNGFFTYESNHVELWSKDQIIGFVCIGCGEIFWTSDRIAQKMSSVFKDYQHRGPTKLILQKGDRVWALCHHFGFQAKFTNYPPRTEYIELGRKMTFGETGSKHFSLR